MKTQFWYVYKKYGGAPHYQHPTFESAVEEAKRLVDTVGGEYEILEAKAIVKVAPRHIVEHLHSARAISNEQDPCYEPPF